MTDKQYLISLQKGVPYHPFAENRPFNSFFLMEQIPDEEKFNKPAGLNINTIPSQLMTNIIHLIKTHPLTGTFRY